MIIRVSLKLGQKIHVAPTESLPMDPNPFADWSASLFLADRIQYILLTNTATLYSVVMFGKGVVDDGVFIRQAVSCIGAVLKDDGHEFIFTRLVAPAAAAVTFSKAFDRSVTGSMNDLTYQAQGHIIEGLMSPHATSFRLNDAPMGSLKYDSPRERFMKMKLQNTEASGK